MGGEAAIAFVEDMVPREVLGSGHPRALAVLRELAGLADQVGVVPTQPPLTIDVPIDTVPGNVVVAPGAAHDSLVALLSERPRRVRLLWASRPHNMALVAYVHARFPALFDGIRIIYDSEAVFARREAIRQALAGTPLSPARAERMIRQELYAAEIAHAAAAVSEDECEILRRRLACPIERLGYRAEIVDDVPAFAERSGVLFVGAAPSPMWPNGDSLRFLLGEVWPRLGAGAPPLVIAGRGCEPDGWLASLVPGGGVRLAGPVADLAPLYGAARVFVAPTRFASGIPIKVIDATRHGVPVVATPLLAGQLRWHDGDALRVAGDPDAFAAAIRSVHDDHPLWLSLRERSRAALVRDFDPTDFRRRVRRLAEG